jgi:hypothetical protein
MSYSSIYQSAYDAEFLGRITACCATQDGVTDPGETAAFVTWPVCTASDVEAAYEAALISGNPHPGDDPAVVTDQMILSHVQANLPTS